MPAKPANVLVIEDDPFLRVAGILLDPATSTERHAAFADFFSSDEPDFDGYVRGVRARMGALFPAEVRFVDTQEELRSALLGAKALVVESLKVGREELAAGPDLKLVHKFGAQPRNIDRDACAERGIGLLTLRRRSNYACAETAFALMLILAKKLNRYLNRISVEQLADVGQAYRPFDRRHTPGSNWARIPGIEVLLGSTAGIIGLGEIGTEIALRTAAFGMPTVYYQRTRASAAEERRFNVTYAPLDQLLAASDWVFPCLPMSPTTKGLIGREQLAQIKPGARIVNVTWGEIVNREALIEALRSGRLGGFGLDPLYEVPGRSDDELLRFDNVVLTPRIAAQPRFNALDDLAELVIGIAKALTP